MSGHGRTDYRVTCEPDLDYSPDAGTGLLSSISYALQRGILLRRENRTYMYWAPVAAATRGLKMVLFTASRGNNFVGGTCAPPSALLVRLFINFIRRLSLRELATADDLSFLQRSMSFFPLPSVSDIQGAPEKTS